MTHNLSRKYYSPPAVNRESSMNCSIETPSPKKVLDVIMVKEGESVKTISSRADPTVTRSETFLVYSCPKGEKCKDGGQYCFQKGAGFFNPFRHLKSCLARGETEKLYSLYHNALKQIQSRNCNDANKYFPATLTFKNSEKALYGYIHYIFMLGNPIYHIESPIVRNEAC